MKNRKKSNAISLERRNAIYHKTILHNRELARKNTELSHRISYLDNVITDFYFYINRKRWWQFWKWFK